ncbi:MAG: hypothetical protein ACLFR2_00630 [Candidatus Kapaibacterium sp.]
MDPKQGYILFSGGAPGTEDEFGRNAELYGIEEVNYSFEGHENNRYRGLRVLNSRELEHGDISLTYASNLMNREYPRTRKFRKILQSIWYQVVSSRQVFVVGRILEDHTVKGGTGWGAEFAKITNKPLFVFDQEKDSWYKWNKTEWMAIEPPAITEKLFCGTGTRDLLGNGRLAIRALFERTFGTS